MTEQPLRILLIEDEVSLRESLAQYLQQTYRYQVDAAASGVEALAYVETNQSQYDVALIDYILPATPGHEPEPLGIQLMTQLRAHCPQTEFILFTGLDVDVGLEALRAGAYRYLHKSFDRLEIGPIIEHAVEHRRLKSAARERLILEQLMSVSAALHSGRSLQEILGIILREVQALGFDRVRLYLLSEDGHFLIGQAQIGMDETFVGLERPVATDLHLQALLTDPRPQIFTREAGKRLPYEERLAKEDVNQWVCVPLRFQGKMIGKLSADNKFNQHLIRESALGPLALFADQAAVAIENTRLLDKTKQNTVQLNKLRYTTLAITSQLTGDKLLQVIIDQAIVLLGAKRGGIYEYDPERGELRSVVDSGLPTNVQGQTLHIGEGMAGRLVQTDAPYMIVENYEQWPGKAEIYAGKCTFGAVIEVPLKWQAQLVGVLSVYDETTRKFTADDGQLLQLFADHAAIALVNAKLVSQLEEQKDYRERLITSSPAGVIAVDSAGNVTSFNEQSQRLLKYKSSEVLGKPVTSLYLTPREPYQIGKLLHQAPEGKLLNYETFLRSKTGEYIPIRLAATWLYDAQERRIGSVGYFEDLRILRDAERRLDLLLKASNVVTQAEHLTDGLQHLSELLVTFLDVPFGGIELLDEAGQFLVVDAAFPTQKGQLDWHARIGERTAVDKWVGLSDFLAQSEPFILRMDEKRHQSMLLDISRQYDLTQTIQAMLFIPLRTRQRTVGLLFLGELDKWEEHPFAPEKVNLAVAIAHQTAVLIDRMRLHEITERRRRLLAALNETLHHIRAEKEPTKLLQEAVRLAAALVGCTAGGLWRHRLHIGEVELHVTYGFPEGMSSNVRAQVEGLVRQVIHTGQPVTINDWLDEEINLGKPMFKFIGVPLKQQTGEVEAVLFVADNSGSHQFAETDQDILHRFAAQAAITLQTSQLLNQEQRALAKLSILHEISDYIQAAVHEGKILHVVLTGITAGFGLGFNRAALFLLDEKQQNLVGRMGIGHLEATQAREDWTHDLHSRLDFKGFLGLLEQDALPLTPIGEQICGLHLPLRSVNLDIFSRVILEKHYTLVKPVEFANLPSAFHQVFEPALPLIVAPLIARDQAIGLLVADNKFTRTSITNEDAELLMTFANTAAIAIDNLHLLHEMEVAREQLRSFYAASNVLVLSQDTAQILKKIVEHARSAANAKRVSVILLDEIGQIRDCVIAGADTPVVTTDLIRLNGYSMQVIHTGQPVVIEDTSRHERINPSAFWHDVASGFCLPIFLEGIRIGVMWFHYDSPRYFSERDLEAAQLYVNQAAVAYDSARRMAELEHLRRAADALAGAAELRAILDQIVHSAQAVLQADSAVIWSYDAANDRFILQESVAIGIPSEVWEEFHKIGPRPGGTAYTVMEQGWLSVQDVENLEQYGFLGGTTQKLLKRVGARSFQAVALKVGNENLGVLYMNYNRLHSCSAKEVEIAQTFANHAALALKKVKLLEQVGKARNAAQVMAESIVLERLDSTLEAVVRRSYEVLGCHMVTLYVYNKHRGKFNFPPTMIGVNQLQKVLELGEVPENSAAYKIIKLDDLYVADHATTDPIMRSSFAEREGIRSSVGVPLIARNQKVGVMFVNYRSTHRFSADELANIRLFALQAAVAIRNAQLYEELQKQKRVSESLYHAVHAVTGSLDLQEILYLIVEQAARLTDYEDKSTSFANMMLVKGRIARYVAAHPRRALDRIHEVLTPALDLTKGRGADGRIGIMGRAIKTGEPQLVSDVTTNADYLCVYSEIHSELAVPIWAKGEVIGAINVEHSAYNAFDYEHLEALKALAAQAGIAIHNAQLYAQQHRRVTALEALHKAGRTITSSLNLNEILSSIAEQACELTEKAKLSNIELREGNLLLFKATYPPEHLILLQKAIGRIDLEHDPLIGIVGRTVLTGQPQLIADVTQDPDYIPYELSTYSQLSVPITVNQAVIGVISLEHPDYNAFDDEDLRDLEALAAQAAVAIQNAHSFEDLKKIKGYIGSKTAVDWIQMVSMAWGHSIRRDVGTALCNVALLRNVLTADQTTQAALEELEQLEGVIKGIGEIPIIAPLSYEDIVSSVHVNELVEIYLKRLWKHDTYKPVKLQLQLQENLDRQVTVRASREWLRRVFEIIVDNAVMAMQQTKRPVKQLTVSTKLKDGIVEISFSDTGPGIRPEIRKQLFEEPIAKPIGSRGAGIGMLLAKTIVQTYKGDIYIKDTNRNGTHISVTLPREA